MSRALHHRDIILMFGRFPHRSAILNLVMAQEDQEYLLEGGYTG